jgi:thioredoxin 1
MAREINDQEFKSEILTSKILTVLDFHAAWCGPCRALGPTIDQLAETYAGQVNIVKMDVDANPETAQKYSITSIPAVLFIKDGEVIDKLTGAQTKSTYVKKIDIYK